MRATVPYPVSPVDIAEEDLVDWANAEARVVLDQSRSAHNYECKELTEVVTSVLAGYETLWETDELATNTAFNLEANVIGISDSGAAQRAGYKLFATFQSTASSVAQVGSTTVLASNESDALIDVRFGVDTTNRIVYLEGRDNGTSPMRFVTVMKVNET